MGGCWSWVLCTLRLANESGKETRACSLGIAKKGRRRPQLLAWMSRAACFVGVNNFVFEY